MTNTVKKFTGRDQPMLDDLARSGIEPKDARRAGMKMLSPHECDALVGYQRPGYRIPYFDVDGRPIEGMFRVRFTDEARQDQPKYMGPAGVRPYVYFPPVVDWREIIDDPSKPVTLTEGEKKALSACLAGVPTVAIGGVDSYRSSGRHVALLPELELLCRGGRTITVVYDSDVMAKRGVQSALAGCGAALTKAGARVRFGYLAPTEEIAKMGIDDLLVSAGPDALRAVLDAAVDMTVRRLVEMSRKYSKADVRNRDVADLVLVDAKSHGRFIKTSDALLYFDSATRRVLPLEDSKSRDLRAHVDARSGVTGACPEWPTVYERLANECALNGEAVRVYKLAHYDFTTHTHYQALSDSDMLRTTRAGSFIVPNGTDGVFMRTRGKLTPIPVKRGKGDPKNPDSPVSVTLPAKPSPAAFRYVSGVPNFGGASTLTAANERVLFEIYMLAPLFPELLPTRPLLLSAGEKGSGKTFGVRGYGRVLLGPQFEVFDVNGEKLDGMDAAVAAYPFCVFDNVDGKQGDRKGAIENRMAIYATGGVMMRRKLFTTMDEQEIRADSFTSYTSRDPKSFTRDDIVDRLMILPCERRGEFRPESEMLREIDDRREAWWTYVISRLPLIVDALKKARTGDAVDERLADFTRFALIVGPIIGRTREEVRDALTALSAERAAFAASSSNVIEALGKLIDAWQRSLDVQRKLGKGAERLAEVSKGLTSTELLAKIKAVDPELSFHSGSTFSYALRDERKLIESRFAWTVKLDRKGVNRYTLAPKEGWQQ